MDSQALFEAQFARWRRRIQHRRWLAASLTVGAWGWTIGALTAAVVWWVALPWLQVYVGAGAVLATLIALVSGARSRWDRLDTALYLDARLGEPELISTAVGLAGSEKHELGHTIVERAGAVLANVDARSVVPRVLRRIHGLLPCAALGVGWLLLHPPAWVTAVAGTDRVQSDLKGLERVERLAAVPKQDPATEGRLRAIAEQARRLRQQLKQGIERQAALGRVQQLRENIAKARLRLDDTNSRRGLETTIRELRAAGLERAARALSNGDLTQFDQEMERAAKLAEGEAREAAARALERARAAAKAHRSENLGQLLERQQRLFEEREARGQALRELAAQLEEHLSTEARRQRETFEQTGDPVAAEKLGEALEEALSGLSPAERRALAKRLAQDVEQHPERRSPLSRETLQPLLEALEDPETPDALEQRLEELARSEPGADALREQALDDAERGGAEAAQSLVPLPTPGATGSPGAEAPAQPLRREMNEGHEPSSNAPGTGEEGSPGSHDGQTDGVVGEALRAKAPTHLNPNAPMRSASLGRTAGRAEASANQLGSRALGAAAASELSAVERTRIPPEYREQVGRYFEP